MTKCNQVSPDEPSDQEARFNDAHDEWLDRFDRAKIVFEETYLQEHPEPVFEENPSDLHMDMGLDDIPMSNHLFDLGKSLMEVIG